MNCHDLEHCLTPILHRKGSFYNSNKPALALPRLGKIDKVGTFFQASITNQLVILRLQVLPFVRRSGHLDKTYRVVGGGGLQTNTVTVC